MALTASISISKSLLRVNCPRLTQVVETRVETDLVHDNNTGLLAALLESLHGGGDVRGSHDIGL